MMSSDGANIQSDNELGMSGFSQAASKNPKQKHDHIFEIQYAEAKKITDEEKRAIFASQKRSGFSTEEKKKQKEMELIKEWENARQLKLIGDLETILIQNDYKLTVNYERLCLQA